MTASHGCTCIAHNIQDLHVCQTYELYPWGICRGVRRTVIAASGGSVLSCDKSFLLQRTIETISSSQRLAGKGIQHTTTLCDVKLVELSDCLVRRLTDARAQEQNVYKRQMTIAIYVCDASPQHNYMFTLLCEPWLRRRYCGG